MMNRYDDRIPSEAALKRLHPTVADGILLAVLITAVSINLFSSLAATRHNGGSIVISADDRSDNTLSLGKKWPMEHSRAFGRQFDRNKRSSGTFYSITVSEENMPAFRLAAIRRGFCRLPAEPHQHTGDGSEI